jgi:preprotein translocase subunit SecG
METWWRTHKKLLIDSGLNLRDIQDIVDNGDLEFRGGAENLFDFTFNNKINTYLTVMIILFFIIAIFITVKFASYISKDINNLKNDTNYSSNHKRQIKILQRYT